MPAYGTHGGFDGPGSAAFGAKRHLHRGRILQFDLHRIAVIGARIDLVQFDSNPVTVDRFNRDTQFGCDPSIIDLLRARGLRFRCLQNGSYCGRRLPIELGRFSMEDIVCSAETAA